MSNRSRVYFAKNGLSEGSRHGPAIGLSQSDHESDIRANGINGSNALLALLILHFPDMPVGVDTRPGTKRPMFLMPPSAGGCVTNWDFSEL